MHYNSLNVSHKLNLLKEVPSGTADEMNVIIEIPKGSNNKYEIDKETGIIALDRVHHTTQATPFDYGFVPQTLWEDGDALDVIVLTSFPLAPGILVRVRPVGIMDMVDDGDPDAKIIAVPVSDPRWEHVQDLGDVNKHTIKEMEHYFTTYKNLQKKVVTIHGFKGKEEAVAAFHKGVEAFKKAN